MKRMTNVMRFGSLRWSWPIEAICGSRCPEGEPHHALKEAFRDR
jgi:hypothetical protein